MCNYTVTYRPYPMVWMNSWGLGRSMTGELMRKTFGEEENTLFKWSKDTCVLCKCLSNGDISRGGQQASRMACSVDRSQLLSLTILVIVQWTHEQSGHHNKDGDSAWDQQHGLPFAKADLDTSDAECQGTNFILKVWQWVSSHSWSPLVLPP